MVNLLENVRDILVIQLGDIGDVVWATPTLRAIKRTHPGARLSVLVRDGIGCLLAADPSLHRVYEVKRRKGNLFRRILLETEFIRELRRQRFDIAIDLRLDERGAYMAFASGAPVRVRLYNRDVPYRLSRLFTHLLTPPPRPTKARGAAEQTLALVREMGVDTEDIVPRLWVAHGSRYRAREILRDAGVDGGLRWVSVNPFSRWTYKEWGHDKWARIIDWLGDEYRMAAVLVGSGEEREKAEGLAGRTKGKVFNLAGRTTLDELAALLEMSIMNIGVDSAAPHIAAAVGTPTITLYGPSDWEEWAPVGDRHHVIVPDRDCVPCYKKGCDGKGVSLCLEELTVERVKEEIRKALAAL
jgi:heptosyltransferase-3